MAREGRDLGPNGFDKFLAQSDRRNGITPLRGVTKKGLFGMVSGEHVLPPKGGQVLE